MRTLVPSVLSRAVDESGHFLPEWSRFFARLAQAPSAFVVMGVPASPAGIIASQDGTMLVSGGTVSLIRLQRGNAFLTMPGVAGLYPVSAKDAIVITYTVAPTVTFIPR